MQSLLWPQGTAGSRDPARVAESALRDLELDELAAEIAQGHPGKEHFVREALLHPPRDPAVSRWRAECMAELMQSAALCDGLESAARALHTMAQHRPQRFADGVGRAARIGARLVELESYLQALEELDRALGREALRAEALCRLRDEVAARLAEPSIQHLRQELPGLRAAVSEARSITVGINVGPALEPESAVLTGISSAPASADAGLLARVSDPATARRGLVRLLRREPVDWGGPDPTLRAIRQLLDAVAAPVERALLTYRAVGTQHLAHLQDEIVLLTGAARLARRWQALGLPCCLAQVMERASGKQWTAEQAYHPLLALRLQQPMVPNAISFGPQGSIWVLTGPNRGGKTTYLRTAGLVQILGQAGLPVPAARADIWPVDAVFTHFPALETETPGQGRLDEEAARLAAIFRQCSAASLILLNEVLAGTSAAEGAALAADVLCGFRAFGCSVIYATHLHELALRVPELNRMADGPSVIGSLTVQSEATRQGGSLIRRPTYRIVPGPPEGASFFASEIAARHGISLPQLLQLAAQRGEGQPAG